jgi:CHAD domain-containing protein
MPDHLLSQEERQQIQKLAIQTADDRLRRRAALLLLYDQGKPTLEAARESGISRGRARFWKRQFRAIGMAVFGSDSSTPSVGQSSTRVAERGEEDLPGSKTEPGSRQYSVVVTDIGRLSIASESQTGENTLDLETETGVGQFDVVTTDIGRLSLYEAEGLPVESFISLAEFAATAAALESPGVLPTDPLAEAGRKVWRYHFAQMLLHEAGTLLGENFEELHDMRVATRRMRAAFDVFGNAFTPKALKSHLKGLRRTGRTLGRVRDLDVFIEKARRYQAGLPEEQRLDLEPLLEAWLTEREAGRQEMAGYLQGNRYLAFKEKFYHFLSSPGSGAQLPSGPFPAPYRVREAAPALIYNRLASVRAFDAVLPQASLAQFHALRIEFKKLRYTLEFFREVLGEEAKPVINELKGLQDHLGDLNDANVASGILLDFLARWDALQSSRPVAERRGPEPILAYLSYQYAERQHLMVSFGEAWQNFNRAELREKLARAVSVL